MNDQIQVGELVRWWRSFRRLSQMDLAFRAGISPRHMSFIETGRSRPGRDVLLRLARRLDIPFRDQNRLLESAGYARMYPQTELEDPDLDRIREVLAFLLERHEPYGAIALDAEWRVRLCNDAHRRLMRFFVGCDLDPANGNVLLQLFHPSGLRPYVANWPEVAHVLLERVRKQIAEAPSLPRLRALLKELESFGVPAAPQIPIHPTKPVLPLHLVKGTVELRLLSVVTMFGTPRDVTVQELWIETFLPADDETDAHVRRIVESGGSA